MIEFIQKKVAEDNPCINPFTLADNPINDTADGPQTELDLYEANNDGSKFFNPAKKLRHLEASSRDLEKTITKLCGHGEEECQMATKMFFNRSTYSPIRLTAELGWEPTARGGGEEGGFLAGSNTPACTWYDAFEDLIRISSGLEMTELSTIREIPATIGHYDIGARLPFLEGTVKEAVRGISMMLRSILNEALHSYLPVKETPRTMEEWVAKRQSEGLAAKLRRKRYETASLTQVGRLFLEQSQQIEASMVLAKGVREDIGVVREAEMERVKKGDVKEVVASNIMLIVALMKGHRELMDTAGRRSCDRNTSMLEQIAKGLIVSKGKVTRFEEDGLVRETTTNPLADASGRPIGTQTSTLWRNPSTGEVVKIIPPLLELDFGGTSLRFDGQGLRWKGRHEPDGQVPAVDKSELNRQEGDINESRYKKWSFWK
ncbi:hypothetical protein QBC43DRAFT_33777 [Cladorrhinum sp. PSN259]|nr:hypothetical protein QBC43DRAFT_33777 [Cladorrhinum sp. PSN259]